MSLGPQFDDLMQKKYNILQQNADAETTKANASAQNVAQQQALQRQSDQAAQTRAETVANNQAMIAGMNNQSSQDIAGLNNQGANYRTSLATGTQMNIAGMENALGQRRLDQQGQQFGQTLGLDRDKFDEQTFQDRLKLTRPITIFDPDTSMKKSVDGIDFSKLPNVLTGNELLERRSKLASGS